MRHVEAFQQLDVFFAKALAYGCKSVCRCWPYYAAPTELTAIWMPVAIKILLLRSTISVFQMSKLPSRAGTGVLTRQACANGLGNGQTPGVCIAWRAARGRGRPRHNEHPVRK